MSSISYSPFCLPTDIYRGQTAHGLTFVGWHFFCFWADSCLMEGNISKENSIKNPIYIREWHCQRSTVQPFSANRKFMPGWTRGGAVQEAETALWPVAMEADQVALTNSPDV